MTKHTNLSARRLSPKQRVFVRTLLRANSLEEAKNRADLLSQQPEKVFFEDMPRTVSDALNRLGLSLVELIEKHLIPMLEATKFLYIRYKGRFTQRLEVPDNATRLRALIMVLELYGAFDQENDSHSPAREAQTPRILVRYLVSEVPETVH